MANLFMRWQIRAIAYDGTYVTDCAEHNLRLNVGSYIVDLADQIVRAWALYVRMQFVVQIFYIRIHCLPKICL